MLAYGPLEALHGGLRPGLPVSESRLCPREELQTRGGDTLCAEKETGFLAALSRAFLREYVPRSGTAAGRLPGPRSAHRAGGILGRGEMSRFAVV